MEQASSAEQELATQLITEALMFMHNIGEPEVKENAVPTKYTDFLGNDWGECIVFTKENKSMLMTQDEDKNHFVYTNGVLRVIILDRDRIILQKLNSTKLDPNGILSEGTTIQ